MGDFGLSPSGSTVTVGTFDGVHRAHHAVLRETAERAEAAGRACVVVTFDPHPVEVVRPERAPLRLTTEVERRVVMAACGVQHALVLRFDEVLAALPPERFVRDILVARCGMKELVVGHDHGFGRGRSGDADTLRRIGEADGFEVVVVPQVEVDGVRVSSSAIRQGLVAGDLDGAARMLGRRYDLMARVGEGAGRGRRLGVPTINLAGVSARKQLPPDGVYAVRVEWRGGRAGGMMNQGPRPTFGENERTLEAHLFGVDADLYGEWVRLEWVARLREVRQFASPAELMRQLDRDHAAALAALGDPA
jgi:riboflavin kinase/FMN adenylyltransferase